MPGGFLNTCPLKHQNGKMQTRLLGKKGGNFVVGDPLSGREELPSQLMNERYDFTGFYLVCP